MNRAKLAWLCAFAIILMSRPGFAGGTSTTNYWYGGELHPLVVTRDGVNYRLIGKSVVEMVGGQPTRSYAHADRLGSLRVVTDDQGKVVQSLGYDDYGLTRIESQSTAATDDSMTSFYRFQGQEQETFPLAKLGIQNEPLAQWLDQLQLYHFPWRDYAAGTAAFTETDPIPTQDSLYAALAANPVNFTDETGGMIEESKYDDDDDESDEAQVQDLLRRFALNPEMHFTLKQHELLGKAYLVGRNAIVAEIERYNALRWEISTLKRRTRRAADAAEDQEERDVLEMDFYYFRKWHLDVINRWKIAQQKLAKFDEENASLGNAWKWSALSRMLSKDDSESDDEIVTDLLQSTTISPSPAPSAQAAAVAAPENSTVHGSQAMDGEEKTEEANEEHDPKGHESHDQMKNLEDGSS